MTARPTAAAATWPYLSHRTIAEVEADREALIGGIVQYYATYALTHSQGGAPRNRRAEEAGAPTPASNFAGVA